jgi:predicted HTH domain antitoxin
MGNSVTVSFELERKLFAALRKAPDEFALEMRLAAAVKWYEMGQISQEQAAQLAGLSRAEFIASLHRFRVSPFQYDASEILAELAQ